jgi:hypothetical protein
MQVELAPKDPHAFLAPLDRGGERRGDVLRHLWWYYFPKNSGTRLKRCPVCRSWFVDTSKNRVTARCSSACTALWWSRDRRKAAGHRMKSAKPPGTKYPAKKASTRCPGSNQKVSASVITSHQLGNRHWETAACPRCTKRCAVSLETKTIVEHKK